VLRRRRRIFRTATTTTTAAAPKTAAAFRSITFRTRRCTLGIRTRGLRRAWFTRGTRFARRPRLLLLRRGRNRIRSGFVAPITAAATPATLAGPFALGLRNRGMLLRRTLLLRRALLLRTTTTALRTLRTAIASSLA
jgi:hypothetical protein